MALNFPNSPALYDLYTLGTKTWQWDGSAWISYNVPASGYSGRSGYSGTSGFSGATGAGTSGYSGFSGAGSSVGMSIAMAMIFG